jgi:hypothetical protein
LLLLIVSLYGQMKLLKPKKHRQRMDSVEALRVT